MAAAFIASSSENYLVNSAVATAAPLTMACWATVPDSGSYVSLSIGKQSLPRADFTQWLEGLQVWASANDAASTNSSITSADMVADTWHHACSVFASSTSRTAYLDGVAATEGTVSKIPLSLDKTTIGSHAQATPGAYMNSNMAEAAMWSVALTQAEINTLAAGYSPLFVRPASLIMYVPLVLGDQSIDLINGNIWTKNGTPTATPHPRIIMPSAKILQFPPAAAAGATSKLVVMKRRYR